MNGDLMPIGGHKRKFDPKHAQRIKEGGIRAQKIAKETEAKHQEEDIPLAEETLLQELEGIEDKQKDHS